MTIHVWDTGAGFVAEVQGPPFLTSTPAMETRGLALFELVRLNPAAFGCGVTIVLEGESLAALSACYFCPRESQYCCMSCDRPLCAGHTVRMRAGADEADAIEFLLCSKCAENVGPALGADR